MRTLILIVDLSGSIIADNTEKVGQVNDLIRDIVDEAKSNDAEDIRIVGYGKTARLIWSPADGGIFRDFNAKDFAGLSNLGQAYALVNDMLVKGKIARKNCVLALISDGEATDNYKKQLALLDPQGEIKRTAISIGNVNTATEKHASAYDCSFRMTGGGREDFMEKIIELLED